MILEFSVENFLSFKEKAVFSMLGDSDESLKNNFVRWNDKKILKSSAIYGANASGKSNFIEAIGCLSNLIRQSNSLNIGDYLSVAPFIFDEESAKKPTSFEIRFIVNGIRYIYGVTLDRERIYEEYLYYYPNNVISKIFDRTNTDEYSFIQKYNSKLNAIATKNPSNKFFLSTATTWNFNLMEDAFNFLANNISVVYNISSLKKRSFRNYFENEEWLKPLTLDLLKKLDSIIVDYQVFEVNSIDEYEPGVAKAYQVAFKHKNSKQFINFNLESEGTQILFIFIPFIYDALNSSHVLLVDELDRSLHPSIVEFIVNLFNNSKEDYSSQIIFNTHDTNLLSLDILRRDQIWFTEKNDETGESVLYPLSDFSVRKDENVEKGYLQGRYGAVPFLKKDFDL